MELFLFYHDFSRAQEWEATGDSLFGVIIHSPEIVDPRTVSIMNKRCVYS